MSFDAWSDILYSYLLPGPTPGSPRVLLSLLMLACTMDHHFVASVPDASDDEDPNTPYLFGNGDDEPDADGDGQGTSGGEDEPDQDPDQDEDQDPEGSEGEDDEDEGLEARPPERGEIVLSELMIDPDATSDRAGEWLEIRNTGSALLDLSEHVLFDDGVDEAEIFEIFDGSLELEVDGYLVLCAEPDEDLNGGVECDGSYTYETWGGGFALSNGGDEVGIEGPDGRELDVMAYDGEEVSVGASLGLDPSATSPSSNDDADAWCPQDAELSGGDQGTPGRRNQSCG